MKPQLPTTRCAGCNRVCLVPEAAPRLERMCVARRSKLPPVAAKRVDGQAVCVVCQARYERVQEADRRRKENAR